MSTSDDRPYDQESAEQERAGEHAGRSTEDDTGVERHAPSSANELWDHNAYGREDGNVGGRATSGVTDTRDPRGGAPAYNIDAGDDDAVRHGDDADPDGDSGVRETGESLTGADATAGHGRESVTDGPRDAGPAPGEEAFDQEAAGGTPRGRHAARERGAGGTSNGADGRGGEPPPGGDVAEHDLHAADRDGGVAGTGAEASVVRHEERVRVSTERAGARRVRLRKYVVQEPVRHEQTLVSEDVEEIRTPVTDEEREAFLAGQELPVGEDEVVLYREVPVVQTVRVPYERVRLVVRRTERADVIEDTVRKERVDVEED